MSKSIEGHASQGNEAEGFYSRWSKRKLQAHTNLPAALTEIKPSVDALADEQESSDLSEETIGPGDKDMPDLDTLNEDSDYSCFLAPGVSDKLRTLALRKLFSGQSFNQCDGLDDYDEEFISFEKLGDIVTADLRYQLEQEARQKLLIAAENEDSINDITNESNEIAMSDDNNPGVEASDAENTDLVSGDETSNLDIYEASSIEDNRCQDNENPS